MDVKALSSRILLSPAFFIKKKIGFPHVMVLVLFNRTFLVKINAVLAWSTLFYLEVVFPFA